nr:hypothetical protein KPHV_86180 [Kitasatospora purpeofusca]
MPRRFAAASIDGRPVLLDPATGSAHQAHRAGRGRYQVVEQETVFALPEVPRPPVLAVRASTAHLADPGLAERLARSGVVAVTVRAGHLDAGLVQVVRRLARGNRLVVALDVDRPGLPQLVEDLVGHVHVLRVLLHAPVEDRHDRQRRQGAATYQQQLSAVRAAIDARLPVQLRIEAPAAAHGSAARRTFVDDAVLRARQLDVCGLTLLPEPARTASPASRVGQLPPADRAWLLRRAGALHVPDWVRVGDGAAERDLHSPEAAALLAAADAPLAVA